MQKSILTIRTIFGIVLVILGFFFLAVIFNPHGLIIPTDEPATLILILSIISMMIGVGSYLASGYDPEKILEPLVIVWLWVFFWVLPLFYLSLPEDALVLILGFSTFIPLLLWIGYTKLKAWYKEKHDA